MSAKTKLHEPVVYSRTSWSYRRWLAYHNGKAVVPKNSCEYRGAVYVKMTGRQLSSLVRTIVSPFLRERPEAQPKPAPRPKPKATKPPLVLRVLWTALWPLRKATRAVFVVCYQSCKAIGSFCGAIKNYNEAHNDILVKAFAISFLGFFLSFIVLALVLAAIQNPLKVLMRVSISIGALSALVAIVVGLVRFFESDFATAIGDFFTSAYHHICRPVLFRD